MLDSVAPVPLEGYPCDYHFCEKVTGFALFSLFMSFNICNKVLTWPSVFGGPPFHSITEGNPHD